MAKALRLEQKGRGQCRDKFGSCCRRQGGKTSSLCSCGLAGGGSRVARNGGGEGRLG